MVEILLATMHRENADFLRDMNIQTNIVVANQANSFSYAEAELKGNSVRLVTTAFRGVGKNRNLALSYSSGDILLFADDDMKYVDGYGDIVEKAFNELPSADIIVFNVQEFGREQVKNNEAIKRVKWCNFSRYGTYRTAIRTSSLKRAGLCFSELFGGGCIYGSGEDTVFLSDAIRAGLKIFTYPKVIAEIDQSNSTWFKGYNAKFMFDKGALIKTAYPRIGFLMKYYFAYKFSKESELSFFECLRYMKKGMRDVKQGEGYKK